MDKCWCGNKHLSEYSENYFKCDQCRTLVSKHDFHASIYDVENEEDDLYGKNYWEVSMTKEAGKNTLSEVVDMYLSERVVYWLKGVLKHVKLGGDIAEVGCGLGQLQYVLSRGGYSQKAFELSPDICKYMEEQLGLNTHCGPFVSKDNAYDGILAFDLFEHLLEPEEFLEDCAKSLREKGILCFQTPCYNADFSYAQMKAQIPKFQEQLKEEQHIYIFSREAITGILKKNGFTNIIFEPAFFGDDYDMFLFASKAEIPTNTEKEIDEYLNSVSNGRLLKAMITLFDEKAKLAEEYQVADRDRIVRLKQNEELENELTKCEADSANRLKSINELTELVKVKESESEARNEQIEELTRMVKDIETDRAARLQQLDEFSEMYKESERNRIAMVGQIEELTGLLQESEADRAARLEQITELTRLLQESEADRAARLDQINELTKIINESKEQKA